MYTLVTVVTCLFIFRDGLCYGVEESYLGKLNSGPEAKYYFLNPTSTQHAVVPGTSCSVSFYVHCT